MKLINHVKNVYFLWWENRKKEADTKINITALINTAKNKYKRKDSWVRNQVVKLVRKIRKVHPYKIIDYSKVKELYDSREPIDLSKVKVGDYVVKFSREEPIKGKRYCEYYINQCGEEGIYKVQCWEKKYESFSLLKYNGDLNHCGLDEDRVRAFRFATKEEITEFKNRRKEYKQKKKEINNLQK